MKLLPSEPNGPPLFVSVRQIGSVGETNVYQFGMDTTAQLSAYLQNPEHIALAAGYISISPQSANTCDRSLLPTFASRIADFESVWKEASGAAAGQLLMKSIRAQGSALTIEYSGVLQSADQVLGPWADVPGAVNPFSFSAEGPTEFWRSRAP